MDPCEFPGNEKGECDFYGPGVFVYENLYLAMPTVHRRNVGWGPHEPCLMVSTDGVHFEWISSGSPIISRTPDDWDAGMIGAIVPPQRVGDRLYIYYHGSPMFHHDERRPYCPELGIGASWIRPDGFLCYWGTTRWAGSVTTPPIVFEAGSQLRVNAETTSETGEMRVEVVGDERFGAEQCRPFVGDDLDAQVTWRDADFAACRGKAIRLRFHLSGARLYAFEIR